MARGGLFLSGLIITWLLSACAGAPQTRQLLTLPGALPPHIELQATPFFPQQQYQCGPAALATVLNVAGEAIQPEQLVDEIYLPARKGSLQIEILASTRRHQRIPYRIDSNLRALLTEVAAGNPVLVLQNLALSWTPQWHYAVVIGYDLAQGEIILRSGSEARHRIALDTFEHTWARASYWGIVVMPLETLPATVEAERYLRAVVALEDTRQWRAAQQAYDTALQRWPNHLIALMGLGNCAYALHDLPAASAAFRRAVEYHPDAAAAHNNLAQVLMEQGKLAEAEAHAQRAVDLGGSQQASYGATLADIQAKRQKEKREGEKRGTTSPADSDQR